MADAELSLIDKVELRITLAGSDSKFESSLDLYLCPLLLKLASPHQAVRQEILKFIQHLIPRINASKEVKLPFLKLIQQGKAPNVKEGVDGATVQLYSLLFASKAVDRLSSEERQQFLPEVVQDIHKYNNAVGARLFHIFCKLLREWKVPDRGTEELTVLRSTLGIDPIDERFLAKKIENLFLLLPALNNDGIIPRGYTCPGLSAKDVSFLTYDAGVSYKVEDLANVKKDITNFLPLFQNDNLVIILLIGVCDPNETVGNRSASLLRKITLPLENKEIVDDIISLYVGDKNSPRSPVKHQIQERFLSTVLTSSKVATTSDKIPLITSIGLNASGSSKLKKSTIQFIQWVSRNSSDSLSRRSDYTISVAAQLKNNLHSEGWPKMQISSGANYSNEVKYRQLQYEALGEVLKRDFDLIKDLSYIEFFFDSLLGDLGELRPTIQEALSSFSVYLADLPHDSKVKLKMLGQVYLQNDDFVHQDIDAVFSVRFTIIKYLNLAFPFEDPEARILNVLGTCSTNRSDVIEEANKGLHPYWFNVLRASNTKEFKSSGELLGAGSRVKFPSFQDYIKDFLGLVSQVKGNSTATLKYSMQSAVEFALRVLVTQAVGDKNSLIVQDQEWTTRLDKSLEFDEKGIYAVKKELQKIDSLEAFLKILLNEFTGKDLNEKPVRISHTPSTAYGTIFMTLTSLSQQTTISSLVPEVPRLLKIIEETKTTNETTLESAAVTLGVIATHPDFSDHNLHEMYKMLLPSEDAKDQFIDGKLLALGYVTSRLIMRGRNAIPESTLSNVYELIVNSVSSLNLKTAEAGVVAIGEIAKVGGFLNKDEIFSQATQNLYAKVKKIDEKSIISWAYLSLNEPESISEDLTKFENAIYDTHNTKQVESLFTSGEAFSIAAAGWDSKYLHNKTDIQSDYIKILAHPRRARLQVLLLKILEACKSTKPSLRRAGCIWLLSLVQYCGHLSPIKTNASLIHVTFMKFLADRDELVQEAASRGLSMIYELGDVDLKETLVKGLLKSFTDSTSSSKLSSGSISEDTELFEPGVLKTDDGSISTYKDILNLASEVGDPGLVYKFMSLAKSSALWSSRKGIAFGLGSIVSKSSLDKLLMENKSLSNRLIPKLYRYRFDPNPSVSKSMNDIWNSIVPDSSKTIQSYHTQILQELLTGMGNKEWRVREASANALNDLLQHLPFDNYEEKMEAIWTMGFRAIDDIKDSVRKAGVRLTKSLSTTLVNSIKIESGRSATKANDVLSKLLPFLLGTKGILSDAEDVRDFALKTVLDLVKKSGSAITPFIAELIEQFVLLMSTLEPQIVNYLALNADKYKFKSDDLDAKRLQSVGNSPIMSALEKLIDLIDENIIGDVIQKLQHAVKQAVGLPSKAAVSRVFVTLVLRHLQIVKPYGDLLLKTCISQLGDRNTTISSSFATSAGYVCRICSIESVVNFASKINSLYFDSEDERSRLVASVASEAVSKYSSDRFISVASAFLPLAFIARNDPEVDIAKHFDNEWSENTSGAGAIKLYIHEICQIVKANIASPKFFIRQTCAKSIAKACNAIENTSVIGSGADELFEVLINACQGRSWSGKEDVLSALISLSLKSDKYNSEHRELLPKIQKIVIVEAKRRNKDYQKFAIASFGAFANKFPSKELQQEALEVFKPLLSETYYDSEEDVVMEGNGSLLNEKSSKYNLQKETTRLGFLSSLSTSFQSYGDDFNVDLLNFALEAIKNTVVDNDAYIPTWKSQIGACESFIKILTVLKEISYKIEADVLNELISTWTVIFDNTTSDEDAESVRIQAIRVSRSLLDLNSPLISKRVLDNLKDLQRRELSSVVQVEITKCL